MRCGIVPTRAGILTNASGNRDLQKVFFNREGGHGSNEEVKRVQQRVACRRNLHRLTQCAICSACDHTIRGRYVACEKALGAQDHSGEALIRYVAETITRIHVSVVCAIRGGLGSAVSAIRV